MPDEMEETMLMLSKGIKWLAVFSACCFLAGAAIDPPAQQGSRHETAAIEPGSHLTHFPVLGISDLMQMHAR